MPLNDDAEFDEWIRENSALQWAAEPVQPAQPAQLVEPTRTAEEDDEETFSAWVAENEARYEQEVAELSPNARRLVKFGLVGRHDAEEVVKSAGYKHFHSKLVETERAIGRASNRARVRNPQVSREQVDQTLFDNVGQDYLNPFTDSRGDKIKEPTLSPESVRVLRRSIIEGITYADAAHDYAADPSSADQYEDTPEVRLMIDAAAKAKRASARDKFSQAEEFYQPAVVTGREDIVTAMKAEEEAAKTGKTPHKRFTGRDGFSPQFIEYGNPTYQDAGKAWINSLIANKDVPRTYVEKFADVIDQIGKGGSELNPGKHDASDFAHVNKVIRDKLGEMGGLGRTEPRWEDPVAASGWNFMDWYTRTMQDQVENALATVGDQPLPTKATQDVLFFGRTGIELWGEIYRSMVTGTNPLGYKSGGPASRKTQEIKVDADREMTDLGATERYLRMAESVSADIEGRVQILEMVDGTTRMYVVPDEEYVPESEEAAAKRAEVMAEAREETARRKGKGAILGVIGPEGKEAITPSQMYGAEREAGEADMELAREEAAKYARTVPREYAVLDAGNLLVKDGQRVKPGDILMKNTAVGGASPMRVLGLMSESVEPVDHQEFTSWFERNYRTRWNPDEGRGEYVSVFSDPFSEESRLEMEKTLWDRASDDPLRLTTNLAQNVIMTMGVVPAAIIYSSNLFGSTFEKIRERSSEQIKEGGGLPSIREIGATFASRMLLDFAEDVVTIAPAAVHHMVEEASYPSRYFYKYPLDAIALAQGATGMVRGLTRHAVTKMTPMAIEAGLIKKGIGWSDDLGYHIAQQTGRPPGTPGPRLSFGAVQEALRGFEGGLTAVDALALDGLHEMARVTREPIGKLSHMGQELALEMAVKPTRRRAAIRKFAKYSDKIAEWGEVGTSPFRLIGGATALSGKGIIYGMRKSGLADKIGLDAKLVSMRGYFGDPSRTMTGRVMRVGESPVQLHTTFIQRRGIINTKNARWLEAGKNISDAEVAAVEKILRREMEGGATYFVEVPDDMIARMAADEIIKLHTEGHKFIALSDKHNRLMSARDLAHESLTTLDALKLGVKDLQRIPTEAELANFAKTGQTPPLYEIGTELPKGEMVVIGKLTKKNPRYAELKPHYDAYVEAFKNHGKAHIAYENAAGEFVKSHTTFVDSLPKRVKLAARDRIPHNKVAREVLDGGSPRFRIRNPVTGVVEHEFPLIGKRRGTPEGMLETVRKDVERAMATGGGGTTIAEFSRRFHNGDPIAFAPGNHISVAGHLELVRQLERQIAEGTMRAANPNVINKFLDESGLSRLTDADLQYLEWVYEVFDIPTLMSARGVYATKMPMGFDDLHVTQLGRPGIHASGIRTALMNEGAGLVHVGLLPKDVFLSSLSVYFPHYYKKYVAHFATSVAGDTSLEAVARRISKIDGIEGSRMVRERMKDLALEKKYDVGLIDEARYTAVRGLIEMSHDLEMARHFNRLSTSKYVDGPWEGMDVGIVASAQPAPGWLELGDKVRGSWKFGKMHKRWVAPEVFHYMKRTIEIPTLAGAKYRTMLNKWKYWMTVLNPATHVRNLASNMVFADQAGMNPVLSESARAAWKNSWYEAWRQEGIWYKRATADGVMGTDFVNAELRSEIRNLIGDIPERRWDFTKTTDLEHTLDMADQIMMTAGDKLRVYWRKGGRKYRSAREIPAALYSFEEELFKITRYKQIWHLWEDARKTGHISRDMKRALGVEDARRLANMTETQMREFARVEAAKWFFDYSDVSAFVEHVKLYASPFITFQYKALPRIAKILDSNPMRGFFYRRLFESINFMTEYMDGMPDDIETLRERELEYSSLPAYARMGAMREPGTKTVKYHGRGAMKKHTWVDMQYYTPFGGAMQPTLEWDVGLWPDILEPRHPLLSTFLGPFYYNAPSWNVERGSLQSESDDYWEGLGKRWKESSRNIVPPMFGTVLQTIPWLAGKAGGPEWDVDLWKGRSAEKLWEAMRGNPYPNIPEGRINTIGEAMKDAALGYRSFSVLIKGADKLNSEKDRRLGALMRDYHKKIETPSIADDAAEMKRIDMEYDADRQVVFRWHATVMREAAYDASVRGKAMGLIKNPNDIVGPNLPPPGWRRDKLKRLIDEAVARSMRKRKGKRKKK